MRMRRNWTRTTVVAAGALAMLLFAAGAGAGEKKVLLVDSYHEGYAWSDGIVKGAKEVLGDKVDLKVVHMDTKRNASEDFKKKAAAKVKKTIETWKPDVVIAADDNASKFLIVPHFKNKETPFVFCGVNWDATGYGFPCKNVTGMVEVALIPPLLKSLKEYAKGERIGFLGPDIETSRKEAANVKKAFNLDLVEYYAKDYADWKKGFQELQKKADMLILASDGGLYDDQAEDMKAFVLANTNVPTGVCYDFMTPYALIGYTKVAEEQGQWAAATALKILDGAKPEEIEIVRNKKGNLFLNLPIAKKLDIRFPMSMVKQATLIKK